MIKFQSNDIHLNTEKKEDIERKLFSNNSLNKW